MDDFDFSVGETTYHCRVTTAFPPPGDGFANVSLRQDSAGAGWTLTVGYDLWVRGEFATHDIACPII